MAGLWDHSEDECRGHMRARLRAYGLKAPKVSVQGTCSDVQPPSNWAKNTCKAQLDGENCAKRRDGRLDDGYCHETCGVCTPCEKRNDKDGSPATTPAAAKKVHTVPVAPQEKECWTALKAGRSPGPNIVARRKKHPSCKSAEACKAECEKFPSCKAIIFRKNVQCTPIARPYESAYESSTTQQVANYLC